MVRTIMKTLTVTALICVKWQMQAFLIMFCVENNNKATENSISES